MTNPIVQVNVSQTIAPTPSALQKTGAFLSQGATNTSPGTFSLVTQPADLTPLLAGAKALSALAWSGSVVTATTVTPHGLTVGDTLEVTISGSIAGTIAAGYNGTFLATITGASTFTYPLGTNPGSESAPGAYTVEDVAELNAMTTSFFAQGAQQAVYVLELGAGNAADGVAFLTAWITANPGFFYSYLVPRYWDGDPSYLAFLQNFNSTTSKTYFHTTTTLATWMLYSDLLKCVLATIECPSYGQWKANQLTAISWAGAWGANALTGLTWSGLNGGQVTATTTTAHGVQPGQFFTLSGSTPTGYNGTFLALAGTTGSTLLYALATNPGAESALGTLVASTFGEVTATTTTAHGVVPGQYFSIAGTTPSGYNGTFLALPGTTGSTLVYALASNPGGETVLGILVASVYSSAGIPVTEFSAAAAFWVTLNYAPSTTNKVTPTAFSFLFGVTPFPTKGNAALLTQLKAASINIVGTGAEGGISDTILLWGTTMDARDFTYWYSVDWVQINLDLNVANAVINGSNNPINPLYYNQDGINRLQQVIASTMASGVTFGLVLGKIVQTALDGPPLALALSSGQFAGLTVVNAVPFVQYSVENPSDYKIGRYSGFAVIYTPNRGFISIIINVNVTDFVAQ